jgi:hypothetical protein
MAGNYEAVRTEDTAEFLTAFTNNCVMPINSFPVRQRVAEAPTPPASLQCPEDVHTGIDRQVAVLGWKVAR